MSNKVKTLNEFIIERQGDFPYAKGELSRLLTHIALAAKVVNREVNQAGLVDILGSTGDVNVQGESVQKLDEYANDKFEIALKGSAECCGIATEERQDIIRFDTDMAKDGKYIVCLDPLDGSSNIDVNVSIGTIFSIYRRVSPRGHAAQLEDFLQEGTKQVAAGYVIYGSSTMMVYTTGRGVNGFTLDPSIGEFCLSHADIHIPMHGTIYSVNEGNYSQFSKGVQKYIDYCKEIDEETKRPYSARYIGSLVADFHACNDFECLKEILDRKLGKDGNSLKTNIEIIIEEEIEALYEYFMDTTKILEKIAKRLEEIEILNLELMKLGPSIMKKTGEILHRTPTNLLRNAIIKTRNFLKLPIKFKPWQAVKLAKALQTLGVVLETLTLVLKIWRKIQFEEKRSEIIKNINSFFSKLDESITPRFIKENYFPSLLELEKAEQELATVLQRYKEY